MAIGLKDIADELSISVSLVSKVLSGRLGTSGASRDMTAKIIQTAHELGYQPNRNASALAMGRNHAIGLLVHALGASGSGLLESTLRGVGAAAQERGQRLWFSFVERDEDLANLYSIARSSGVDGLICAGARHRQPIEELNRLTEDDIPVVTIHSYSPDPLPNVGVSEELMTELTTQHLIEQGCKQIAHLSVQADRQVGYCRALTTNGMNLDARLVVEAGGFDYEAGIRGVRHLFELKIAFDGLVCQSDQQAAGAQSWLLSQGIKVPDQIKITGIDNSPIAVHAAVPITSIDQHFEDRGKMAVELLYDLMRGEDAESLKIAPTLVVRASSRAAG